MNRNSLALGITGVLLTIWPGSALADSGHRAPALPQPAGGAVSQHVLTLIVTEGSSFGAPLDVRVQATGPAGQGFPPADPDIPFYTSYTGHNYFYAHGLAQILVDEGPVRVTVSRGPEYSIHDQNLVITQNTSVNVYLQRYSVDMRLLGYHSGDTHVHIAHGGEGDVFDLTNADLAAIGRAEDLGVVCALSNGLYFTGGLDPESTPQNALYFAMEYRSALFGHMALLGLNSLLPDACCLPGDPPYPLNFDVADDARLQGGTVVLSHPMPMEPALFNVIDVQWPYSGYGREFPAMALLSGADAIDVFSYSNYDQTAARTLWYDLLNLGTRIPLSVGTDASMNRWFDPPPGGYRLYVKLPSSAFNLDQWLTGLRAGKSFATNGPLPFYARLNDVEHGGTVTVTGGEDVTLQGRVIALSRTRVDWIDVVYNGDVIESIPANQQGTYLDRTFTITVPPCDGWVVYRLRGVPQDPSTVGSITEAIVSPIFIDGTDIPLHAGLRGKFTAWIEALELLVIQNSAGTTEQKSEVVAKLESAKRLLAGKTKQPERFPKFEEFQETTLGATLAVEAGDGGVRFRVDGRGTAAVEILSVTGRLVHRSSSRSLPAVFTWSGQARTGTAPAGVYFARVVGEGGTLDTRRFLHLR